MTVADNTSRNQYTATSGQTVFAYTFEIVDKDDIVVLKNGTTLSEGTDYTVSNVGDDNGGNVTLTVGATVGDILTLYRDMPYARTQNYTNSGDFLASEVNSDFDNLWLAGEQTNRSFSQSIRKPITDSDSISMELPEAADRANKYLSFSSTGAVAVQQVTPATDASAVTYTPAGTGAVDTTVQAKLRESVSVKDFGAVGDGVTDDTTAIQAAIDAVDTAGGGEIFFPAGEYKCNVTLKKYVSLRGEGPLASILKPQSDDHVITFDNTDSVQYLKIESIGIEGDQTFTSQDGIHMTPGAGDRYNFIVFDNLRIRNCGRYGIRGVAAADGTGFPFIQSIHIEHCRIQDCLNAGISFDGRVLESSARDTAIVQNGGTSGANNNAELLLNATWGGGPRRFLFSNCALNHFQAISSGNTGTALKLEGTQQAMVQNCDFESANPFISISNSTSRATTIIGCKLQTTYTIANGIDIDAGKGIYIENNTFSATGTATNAINSNVVEGQVLNINVGSANFFSGFAQAWVDNPETTISSGTASISRTTFTVDTEANAATDDLDNIKNSVGNKAIPDGQVIVFGAANGARTVVVKNGTGNINCGSDITLDNTKDRVMLSYNSASETWSLISFSDNGP